MDFQENINESYDVVYEEVGETGDPVFIIKDIDNGQEHRFYPEDLKKIIQFLYYTHVFYSYKQNINESYNIKYERVEEHNDCFIDLEDIDNDVIHTFYTDDIKKIEKFLNRLINFGVIKSEVRMLNF